MYDMSIKGHMNKTELQCIERWASEVPENGVIVEVGSLFGRSAVAWANSCDPSVNVYCVDAFYDAQADVDFYDEFHENTKDIPNIHPVARLCPFFKYSKHIGEPADIFFIDAAHFNPNDWHIIMFGLRNLKSGGLLCGHDYSTYWPDVVENVKRLEEQFDKPVTLYPETSLWSFVVPNNDSSFVPVPFVTRSASAAATAKV
jgi:predicted O-methyltransferase YrrM